MSSPASSSSSSFSRFLHPPHHPLDLFIFIDSVDYFYRTHFIFNDPCTLINLVNITESVVGKQKLSPTAQLQFYHFDGQDWHQIESVTQLAEAQARHQTTQARNKSVHQHHRYHRHQHGATHRERKRSSHIASVPLRLLIIDAADPRTDNPLLDSGDYYRRFSHPTEASSGPSTIASKSVTISSPRLAFASVHFGLELAHYRIKRLESQIQALIHRAPLMVATSESNDVVQEKPKSVDPSESLSDRIEPPSTSPSAISSRSFRSIDIQTDSNLTLTHHPHSNSVHQVRTQCWQPLLPASVIVQNIGAIQKVLLQPSSSAGLVNGSSSPILSATLATGAFFRNKPSGLLGQMEEERRQRVDSAPGPIDQSMDEVIDITEKCDCDAITSSAPPLIVEDVLSPISRTSSSKDGSATAKDLMKHADSSGDDNDDDEDGEYDDEVFDPESDIDPSAVEFSFQSLTRLAIEELAIRSPDYHTRRRAFESWCLNKAMQMTRKIEQHQHQPQQQAHTDEQEEKDVNVQSQPKVESWPDDDNNTNRLGQSASFDMSVDDEDYFTPTANSSSSHNSPFTFSTALSSSASLSIPSPIKEEDESSRDEWEMV